MPFTRIAAWLTVCLAAMAMSAQQALADAGQILLQLDTYPNRTLAHPDKDLIYITHNDGILSIDTVNHIVAASVEIDGRPRGMALSADGETLFVADHFNAHLIVLDAHLQQRPVFMPTEATFSSLAMGLDGRLFATRSSASQPQAIYELDSSTGETNQLIFGDGFSIFQNARLAITPDRTQLWWLKIGGSPSKLAAFNVRTADVSVEWASPHSDFGSNGQDLAISSNGDRVTPCNGAPYNFPAISTESFETLGQFNTGPYPRSAAYSPDDLVFYASHTTGGSISQWDATDYTFISTIPFLGTARELSVDRTGRVLVAGFHITSNNTIGLRLIDTGRSVHTSVHLDLRPGSCPNPLNRKSQGVLPAAILGTPEFDVTSIDPESIVLRRVDGNGEGVAPLQGPPGPGVSIGDVGTPATFRDPCECHTAGGDGIADLKLKFSVPQLVDALALDDLLAGETVKLRVEGELADGTAFEGDDCIVLVGGSGVADLLMLLDAWGECAQRCDADLNDDGIVDINDLKILLDQWASPDSSSSRRTQERKRR